MSKGVAFKNHLGHELIILSSPKPGLKDCTEVVVIESTKYYEEQLWPEIHPN